MLTDHPAVVTILALAAIATAVSVLWKTVGLPVHRLGKRVAQFLDDWNGEPGRPGRPEIKPLPARISCIESKLNELGEKFHAFHDESTSDRADLRARIDDLTPEEPT